jgi:glutamate-ammonia-ligase adenylyltransferase
MVHAYVYAQSLTTAERQQLRHMRHRIETERGDPRHREWEFKTGPGGLIDVEFLVQALQLQHGSQYSQLRTAHTLAALNRLTALGLVADEPSYQLRRGYLLLRRVECVLRRVENTSVSKIPAEPDEQTLLAKRLGFSNAEEFLRVYRTTTRQVRAVYDAIMNKDS